MCSLQVCAGVSLCGYMDVYEHVCLCAGGQMCARMCTLFGGQRLTSGLVFQELCTLFAGLSVRLGWLASELQDLHSPPPPLLITSRSHTWLFTWVLASCLCDTLLNELLPSLSTKCLSIFVVVFFLFLVKYNRTAVIL